MNKSVIIVQKMDISKKEFFQGFTILWGKTYKYSMKFIKKSELEHQLIILTIHPMLKKEINKLMNGENKTK